MVRHLLPVLALASLGGLAHSQAVGTRLELSEFELEGFTQTQARSLEEYSGRALLLEFFAYW